MFTPNKQGSKLDKKGFCKANLTKQTHFSQETLTISGQETLTKQICGLSSLRHKKNFEKVPLKKG